MLDRLVGSFLKLAGAAVPNIDYFNLYRAKVLRQHGNRRRVDVAPVDTRLPTMADIPLKVGVPGVEVTISPGHFVLVGWENGLPNRPYATLWDPGAGGTVPINVTLHAQTVELAGECNLPFEGVVTGEATDTASGLKQWMLGNASSRVGAKKS